MQQGLQTYNLPGAGSAVAAERNRVLRNTYWLLALSMLPTVAGALVGMQFNFAAVFRSAPIMVEFHALEVADSPLPEWEARLAG